MIQTTDDHPIATTGRERAYRHIRNKMMAGSLQAGARLSPTALAREIGISHIPVREAISQLQSEGLITHTPHCGAFVRHIDHHELIDLFEVRALLECRAASLAARHISTSQLSEFNDAIGALNEVLRDLCAFDGTDKHEYVHELHQRWQLADVTFHMMLVWAAQNRHITRIVEDLRLMTQTFCPWTDPPVVWRDPVRIWEKSLQIHRDIHEAVVRRDPKAAHRAMSVHMRFARKNLIKRFDWLRRHGGADGSLTKEFPDSVREQLAAIQEHKLVGVPSMASESRSKK
jgi:DNA-binding GntR family transcriptional regulator